MTETQEKVRLDKWLWAARFFKTRSLAKDAIEGGKVHHEGQRDKVSKEIKVGMTLTIKQGFEDKTITIKALSEVRRGAPGPGQDLHRRRLCRLFCAARLAH